MISMLPSLGTGGMANGDTPSHAALALTDNAAERSFLVGRLADLPPGGQPGIHPV